MKGQAEQAAGVRPLPKGRCLEGGTADLDLTEPRLHASGACSLSEGGKRSRLRVLDLFPRGIDRDQGNHVSV
ncbi:MAG: hypothetical protein LBK25_06495 [Treponema sp.]|nr:hypothetical protein [Treponema sp.]